MEVWRLNGGRRPHVSVLIAAVGGQGAGCSPSGSSTPRCSGLPRRALIPGVASGRARPRTSSRSSRGRARNRTAGSPSSACSPCPRPRRPPGPGAPRGGRAIEAGFASPSRTTIIASTHRLYSIHEKMPPGEAIYPSERILAAARAFSGVSSGSTRSRSRASTGRSQRRPPRRAGGGRRAADQRRGVSQGHRAEGRAGRSNLKGFEVGGDVVRTGVASPRVARSPPRPGAPRVRRGVRGLSRAAETDRRRGARAARGLPGSRLRPALPRAAPADRRLDRDPTRSPRSWPGTSPCG